jgi:hypothetical protein
VTQQPNSTDVFALGRGTGTQRKYAFPNGYGASVVCSPFTYGGEDGLFELAVLGPGGHLTYDTPITSDVIGWLTEDAVQAHLDDIAALPAAKS